MARSAPEERNVLQIARKVAATIGVDFFNAMATHLAKALAADCVLIGEFASGPMERVRTLGASLDGQHSELEFEVAGSAAAEVASGKTCICRSDAASRFPQDQFLPMVRAQSLIATPLHDGSRVPGVIIVAYRRPMVSFRVARQVLDIFSPRAAAELNRKRHDDELRESEQRYRAFITRNPDAMWRIEFEQPIHTDLPAEDQLARIYEYGYVAECNDTFARMQGLERAQQLIGSRVQDIAPKHDASMREATLLAIRSGYEYSTVETNPVDRFGIRRNMLRSQWGIVEDGLLQRIWGTSRDITQLKRSEQELDASEQRMADLLETVQLVVVIVDPQGNIAFCNHYLYRKTGWKQGDLLGKNWLETMVPPEEHTKLRANFDRAAAKQDGPLHYECTLLGPNGRRWHFEWDRTSLRDHEGHSAAWANVGRDVTQYRALREQFLQAQKLAIIGRLVGGLAHDFNNLLTVIIGYGAALLAERNESDPAYLGLSQICKAANKGAELTHRLLAFGRRQVLRPEVLNVNLVIADAEHMIRHLVGDDVRLATDLDPTLWHVRIDAGSFHQILMNLAANARDAMPEGGSIVITTRNAPVQVSTATVPPLATGDYVCITVKDSGTGLSEAARSHLFEPFFTTKEKGTGLGLSTVYGIVQQSGGSVFADSAPERGTSFHIYLPRTDAPETAPAPEIELVPAMGGTETILLVEDREDVRQFASQTLRRLGYTVLEAEGGPAALKLAEDKRNAIDLLLTDISMPDMSGFDLADSLIAQGHPMKVLFMSGFADAPHVAAELAQPGREYLQKPFTPDALAACVRKVLDA